jgi:hypothetical protein
MGHTRLGALPKTRKWNELLKYIAGTGLSGNVADTVANDVNAIAAQTWRQAEKLSPRWRKGAANGLAVLHMTG